MARKAACAQLREVIVTGVCAHLEQYVAELERTNESRYQRGSYKHLNWTVDGGHGGNDGEGRAE